MLSWQLGGCSSIVACQITNQRHLLATLFAGASCADLELFAPSSCAHYNDIHVRLTKCCAGMMLVLPQGPKLSCVCIHLTKCWSSICRQWVLEGLLTLRTGQMIGWSGCGLLQSASRTSGGAEITRF